MEDNRHSIWALLYATLSPPPLSQWWPRVDIIVSLQFVTVTVSLRTCYRWLSTWGLFESSKHGLHTHPSQERRITKTKLCFYTLISFVISMIIYRQFIFIYIYIWRLENNCNTLLGDFLSQSSLCLSRHISISFSIASSQDSASRCFLLRFSLSSLFLSVIQELLTFSSSSSRPCYLSFNNAFQKAVPI